MSIPSLRNYISFFYWFYFSQSDFFFFFRVFSFIEGMGCLQIRSGISLEGQWPDGQPGMAFPWLGFSRKCDSQLHPTQCLWVQTWRHKRDDYNRACLHAQQGPLTSASFHISHTSSLKADASPSPESSPAQLAPWPTQGLSGSLCPMGGEGHLQSPRPIQPNKWGVGSRYLCF